MVLKIYGTVRSISTKRVRVVCEELGVTYEIVNVDLSNKERKSPEYLAKQPFRQIPCLDDDGFVLFENRAIALYIALKYGGVGKLLPSQTDIQKTALFEQAASIELTNFDPSAAPLAWENIFKPMFGLKTDDAVVQHHKTTLEGKLVAYDVILGKTQYLAGDEITLADLFHLPYGSLLAVQGIDFLQSGKSSNVARWWKDISARESWKKLSA